MGEAGQSTVRRTEISTVREGRFEEVTFKQRHKSQIKARQKQCAGVEESFLEKEQRVRA